MQNRTDPEIPRFSTPQPNMGVPLNNIAIKCHKCTKYEIKVQKFFRFLVCFEYFKHSCNSLCWQVQLMLQGIVTETWQFCSK